MPAPVVVSTPAAVPSMAVEACARMVDVAAKSCIAPGAQPAVAQPNWDAMATAIAQQSNTIAVIGLFVTLILFIGGFAWGKIIVRDAEQEARAEARQCVERWIKEEGVKVAKEAAAKVANEVASDVASEVTRNVNQMYSRQQDGQDANGSDNGVPAPHNVSTGPNRVVVTTGAAEETETGA